MTPDQHEILQAAATIFAGYAVKSNGYPHISSAKRGRELTKYEACVAEALRLADATIEFTKEADL